MIRKLEYLTAIILAFVIFNVDLKWSVAAECGDVMASYRGIDAKHNGSCHASETGCSCREKKGYYGNEYQCVEYVNRFYKHFFLYPKSDPHGMIESGNGRDYYEHARLNESKQADLFAYPNKGNTAPKIGDILGFDDGNCGHVAIITGVGINFDSIRLIEQNWSETGERWLDMSKNGGIYTIPKSGSYDIQGWIRKVCVLGSADPSVKWHPDGTLVRASTAVYLIHDGKKKHVTDGNLLTQYRYGFDWNHVIEVTPQEIDCFPSATDEDISILPRLVRGAGPDVYLIFNGKYKGKIGPQEGESGVSGPEVLEGLGYMWKDIEAISVTELNSYPNDPVSSVLYSPYPDGTLVRKDGGTTVYVITNGKKRAITTPAVFNELGYNWDCIVEVPSNLIDNIVEITPAIDEDIITQCSGKQTLSVSLIASPSSGDAPLSTNLSGAVSGTATGTINYTFWWNCGDSGTHVGDVMAVCGNIPTPDPGTCTSNEKGEKCDGVTDNPKVLNHIYSSPGPYTAKVIAERGSAPPVEKRVTISVNTSPSLSDLTASATVEGSYTSGQAGVQIPVTVYRSGGSLTSGTYVHAKLYWSTNSTWDTGDTVLWSSNDSKPDFPNSTLNSSGSETVTATVDIPSVTSSGTYYIIVYADAPTSLYPNGYHSESNEDNNTASQSFAVDLPVADTTPPETSIIYGPSGTIEYKDVSFTYTGSDYVTQTSELVYSYKLDGYYSSWSSYASTTSKSYNDLPNGSYTFYVKAKDQAGNVDSSPAYMSFTVDYAEPASWTIETIDSAEDVGKYTSIAFDNTGNPGVSYIGNNILKYAYFNGASWDTETAGSWWFNGSWDTSLAFDNSENPAISVEHIPWDSNQVYYIYYDGSAWNTENIEGTSGGYTSLAFDNLGYPAIAYTYRTNPGGSSIFAGLSYAHFNGTDWQIERVDSSSRSGFRPASETMSQFKDSLHYRQ